MQINLTNQRRTQGANRLRSTQRVRRAFLPSAQFGRMLLVAVAMVAAAAGTTVVTASDAGAGVGCYGDYCSGRDPSATGCGADARSVASKRTGQGILEVRWSPTCKTNWARLTIYPTGNKCATWGSLAAIQNTGYTQRKLVPATCRTRSATTYWTPMIYSPGRSVYARFCDQDACGLYNTRTAAV